MCDDTLHVRLRSSGRLLLWSSADCEVHIEVPVRLRQGLNEAPWRQWMGLMRLTIYRHILSYIIMLSCIILY